VDGSGSTWTNSDSLYVGGFDVADANGTLDITNGGAVSNAWGCLGRAANSNGTVTVQGAGSTWTNSAGLMVGRAGSGTLSITGGGAVSNTEGWIGAYESSNGTVTVEGAGSTWTNTVGLYVGGTATAAGGTGRLTARDGGLVDVARTLKLWAHGTLEIDGGQVTCGSLDNSAGGTLDFPGGTLTVDGGMFDPGTLGYTLSGAGTPTLRLTNGATADLPIGDLVVGGAEGAGWAAGLSYGVLDGAFTETGENPGDRGIELGPMASEVTDLPADTTHVYTGWFYDADGNVSFYENFDDSVKLIIDGREVMRHTPVGGVPEWEIPHSTGDLALTPDSWHTFELRLGQGGGGSGPPAGMSLGFGFDNYPPICDANDQEWEYAHPVDPGDGSLFRTPVPNGALEVLAGSFLYSGYGYVGSAAGSLGLVTIHGNGPGGPSQWWATYFYLGGSEVADGGSGRVTVSDGGLLDVAYLKLWPGGSLTVDGGGVVIGSTAADPAPGEVRIGGGTLNLAGGRLTCGSLTNDGTFFWSSGTLAFSGELRIDSDSPFGADGGDAITAGRVLEAGDLLVGCNATGTLTITGGGSVSNRGASIGREAGSTGDVTVRDPCSTWTTKEDLFVGRAGTGTLDVENGGRVWNGSWGCVGGDPGSTGAVTVRDPCSTWANSGDLFVAREGSGTLTITAGGAVSNTFGYVGRYADSNGMVTVDGAGSTWANSRDLFVGNYGTATVTIAGGAVSNTFGYVGRYADSNGMVTVDDANSTWTSSGSLYVGGSDAAAGGTGQVTVADGGLVEVGGALKVWPDGTLDVAGGKVRIGAAAEPAAGQVRIGPDGTLELHGGEVTCGALDSSAGGTLDFPGGTLTVDGGAFEPPAGDFTLDGTGSPTLRLTGGAALRLDGNDLIVGRTGPVAGLIYGVLAGDFNEADENPGDRGVQLGPEASEVTDLPEHTTHVYTGRFHDADGNVSFYENFDDSVKLVIDGQVVMRYTPSPGVPEWAIAHSTGDLGLAPNSWHTFELRLGQGMHGSGPPDGMNLGFGFDNEPPICDANDETQYLHPVDPGDGSLFRTLPPASVLEILDGATVSSANGYLGYEADSNGAVTIAGDGSAWTATGSLYVGGCDTAAGGTARVTVADGGLLEVGDAMKLWPAGTVALAAGGRIEAATFDRTAGTFDWHAGGTVAFTGDLRVDAGEPFGEAVTVEPGRTLEVAGTLTVGSGGTLVDANWGTIVADTLEVTPGGAFSDTSSSTLLVNALVGFGDAISLNGSLGLGHAGGSGAGTHAVGPGHSLSVGGPLYVGYDGNGTLSIAGGGAASNALGYIGYGADSNGTVTVRDPCSTWTNSTYLTVGELGTGTLRIAGGGAVSNTFGDIGVYEGSNGTVTVDGAGSTWTNSAYLRVGHHGRGTLTITNGGTVSNTRGYIGFHEDSNGTVTVEGPGSTWTNREGLYVGGTATAAGGTGRLTVSDGGRVEVGGVLKIWPDGTVEVSGGTIHLANPGSLIRPLGGGTFAFHFGTAEFDTDVEITADTGLLTELFGAHPTILQPNGLGITGQATLTVPVTLDGGTFSVGSLINPDLLLFHSGTFGLTDANLAVGPGGLFGARLALREDQRVEVVHDAEVSPGGELGLQGGALAAGRLTNHGLITGRGRIEGPLTNGAGEVEVGPGERLRVTGPAVNDGGQMTLGGGTLHFQDTLTNTGGGLVMGHGLLRADGGLTNEATMAFSGVADLVGDANNTPAGLILATGVGPTTFFDDVHNDGEIRVSAGSTAVYFGAVDGDGNFTGGGTNYFEGDLKPGSSAGIMSFEGNVAFGSFASLEIELGDNDNSHPGNLWK